ncbi:MAG: response regulator [Deltaproteobacteria bacterium]|nr:response regulator [Deltaproteobacteria bacterium]
MRVLLVDDEQELVETLAERLNIRGIEARWVTSGDAALELIDREDFDIAVLDVKIPGMNGINLRKIMKEKRPEMKFIFMTGHGSQDDFAAGSAETGVDYYLLKPVSIDELILKMNNLMNT